MREFMKKLFSLKPKTVPAIEAPYKVETPLVKLGPEPTVEIQPVPAGTPLVNDAGEVVAIADGKPAKGPKVKKAPAAKKAPAVKKPRAPRKPKAE